jgi:DNA primase
MPLTWQALRRTDARDFRITTVVEALRNHGDAWAGWLDRKQDVERTLAAVAAA